MFATNSKRIRKVDNQQKKVRITVLMIVLLIYTGSFVSLIQTRINQTEYTQNLSEGMVVFLPIIEEKIVGAKIIKLFPALKLQLVNITDAGAFRKIVEERHLKMWEYPSTALMKPATLFELYQLGIGIGDVPFYEGEQNTSVAVLDTGIDPTHNVFNNNQIVYWKDFVGKRLDLPNDEYSIPTDKNGHGTAVSAIIAGQNITNGVYTFQKTVTKGTLKFCLYIEEIKNNPIKINVSWNTSNTISVGIYDLKTEMIIAESNTYTNGSFSWQTEINTDYDTLQNLNKHVLFVANHGGNTFVNVTGTVTYPALSLFKGVVPHAPLVVLKVLDDQGVGNVTTLLEALDCLLSIKDTYNIKVVNLSFGFNTRLQVIDDAVEQVTRAGIVVVTAAGNDGTSGEVNSPGSTPYAITVGSVNSQLEVAYYSSHGCKCPLREIKPDVLAPGGEIGRIYKGLKTAQAGSVNKYIQMEGTSFSAAFITGTVYHKITQQKQWNYTLNDVLNIKYLTLLQTLPARNNTYDGDYDGILQTPKFGIMKKDKIEGWGIHVESPINEISYTENESLTQIFQYISPIGMTYSEDNRIYFAHIKTPPNTSLTYTLEYEPNISFSYLQLKISAGYDEYGNPIILNKDSNSREFTLNSSTDYYIVVYPKIYQDMPPLNRNIEIELMRYYVQVFCKSKYIINYSIEYSTGMPYFSNDIADIVINYNVGYLKYVYIDSEYILGTEYMPDNHTIHITNLYEGVHSLSFAIKTERNFLQVFETFNIDLSKPDIWCIFDNNTVISTNETIYIEVEDYSRTTLEFYVNNSFYNSTILEPIRAGYYLTLNAEDFENGMHTLTILAVDSFGRISTLNRTFIVEKEETTTDTITPTDTETDTRTETGTNTKTDTDSITETYPSNNTGNTTITPLDTLILMISFIGLSCLFIFFGKLKDRRKVK